jgi:hypothetical protein
MRAHTPDMGVIYGGDGPGSRKGNFSFGFITVIPYFFTCKQVNAPHDVCLSLDPVQDKHFVAVYSGSAISFAQGKGP